MDVFVCAGCGTELTAPVLRVALPDHTHHGAWEELHPPLMEPATYAVDPLPTGPPWRLWEEVGEEAVARQGVYAQVYSVSFGARNRIVIAPGDSRSMTLIPERCEGYCRGVDGRAGPNLACEGCGRAVATRMDDCGMWQTVWLEPDAVVRRFAGLQAGPPPGWDDVKRAEHRVQPVEPDGSWSRRWEAAVGVALAHLLVVTGNSPVALPMRPRRRPARRRRRPVPPCRSRYPDSGSGKPRDHNAQAPPRRSPRPPPPPHGRPLAPAR